MTRESRKAAKRMKKFTVYHAKKMPRIFGNYPDFNMDNYEDVATVEAIDADDVFNLTNHIDHDWTTNPEVLSCNASCRSTSVGDVIVDTENGKAWRCVPHGWETIGWDLVK
jgi:hypothetical protein